MSSATETKRKNIATALKYQIIAGSLAGATATTCLHPLDLIKVRFQVDSTRPSLQFMRIFKELSYIYKSNGLKGLYRGYSANVTGSTVSWGVYFLLYNKLKASWESDQLSSWQYFVSSGAAGMLTVCVSNPIWLAKTRLCQPYSATGTSVDPLYFGMFDCWRKIWRLEGIRGLYRGFIPGLIGTTHGAVQFLVYERLKLILSQRNGGHNDKLTIPYYLAMSSSSKIIASCITYPYQLVRCRLQMYSTDNNNTRLRIIPLIRKIRKQEGLRAFYKGIIPSTIRVLPGTCITFTVYEKLIEYFTTS